MTAQQTARQTRTIWLLCANCKAEWVAEEAAVLAPGKFIVDGKRWRAACPVCGVHTVGVWRELVPRQRPEGGVGL